MKNYLTTSIVITLILGGAAPIIGGALLGITFPEWASSHYPFHSILEGLGAFAALVITTLIMFMRLNGHLIPAYVWLACGLVGMGVLDGFHAILHVGEPFVWTHSLATFVGGAFFALVWLPENVSRGRFADQLPVYVLGITLIFGFVLIGKPELFPLMIFDGQFTPAARGLNITGGIGFLSAAGYLAFSPAIHTTSDRTV